MNLTAAKQRNLNQFTRAVHKFSFLRGEVLHCVLSRVFLFQLSFPVQKSSLCRKTIDLRSTGESQTDTKQVIAHEIQKCIKRVRPRSDFPFWSEKKSPDKFNRSGLSQFNWGAKDLLLTNIFCAGS